MGNFTDGDRARVVRLLQAERGIALHRLPLGRKLYADGQSNHYLILGGTGNWHGISLSLMDFLDSHKDCTELVVTKKYRDSMLVFACSVRGLVENKGRLKRTERDDYHFNVDLMPSGDRLIVLEVPNLILSLVRKLQLGDT
jgi:hypothetical protein